MPQELRDPRFTTSAPSNTVRKLIAICNVLSHPSIINRGLQNIALDAFWPDRTRDNDVMIIRTLIDIDTMHEELRELADKFDSKDAN